MDTLARAARRITRTLLITQSLGSAGFIAVATITSIVGVELSGRPALAGVPAAVYLIGGAATSPLWGVLFEALGRRRALTIGLAGGVAGAGLAAWAIQAHSFALFLTGMIGMGTANAAVGLARFAAAEVHPPEQRGRALSTVVLGGTAGAVFGPILVGPTGQAALDLGLPETAGPYLASLALLLLAIVTIGLGLRPDPRELGRQVAALTSAASGKDAPTRPLKRIFRQPAVLVAAASMVLGQMVMVMLMVIAALHMREHQHSLGAVSAVISSHTLGMFAFSAVSGRIADRWGRTVVIGIGAGTLLLACLVAPLSPTVVPLALALFLLGLGWNFCFVGGSTLLADQLSPSERAMTQGVNDLMIGLASALGSLSSGVVFAAVGFGWMAAVGAAVAVVPLALAVWWHRAQMPSPSAVVPAK